MTTFTQLILRPRQVFSFQPTLDGLLYTGTVTWGLFGQRPYLNIYALTGARILSVPLVGSPDAMPLASCQWNELAGIVVVTTQLPHGLRIGSVVNLTIANVITSNYNGLHQCAVLTPTVVTYPQTVDPGGPATQQWTIGQIINLVQVWFSTSTLILRQSTNLIEVSP